MLDRPFAVALFIVSVVAFLWVILRDDSID
jgi:nitrogen fixation-related uncharacterized protein